MIREVMAGASTPADITAAATAHLTRVTAGQEVQKTPLMAVMGVTAKAAPLTDATVTTPPPITAIARRTAPLTVHLTATGPPTALATTPPPGAMPTPMTPTAGVPPQRDQAAAVRGPTETRPY